MGKNEVKFEYRIIINGYEYYFTLKDLVNGTLDDFILNELRTRNPDRFSGMYSNNNEPIFENDILYSEQGIGLTSGKPSSKRLKYLPCYVKCKYGVESAHDRKISGFGFETIGIDKSLVDMFKAGDYRTLHYLSSIINESSRGWHYITDEVLNGDGVTHYYHKLIGNVDNVDINQLYLFNH